MLQKLVKKRRLSDDVKKGEPVSKKLVRKQLASASFSDSLKERDPMYHVSEEFSQQFDAMGALRAERQGLGMRETSPGLTESQGKGLREETSESGGGGVFASPDRFEQMSNMEEDFEEKDGQHRLKKFSDLSFRRGKLSAAVVQGTGSMMLFSCLKRTLGQSQPIKLQQRKLFEGASRAWKPQAGKAADADRTKFIRNEVFADSAVGLSFDVTKDARRTVDQMTALIEAGHTGTETWERQMPFLSIQKEMTMLEQYRKRQKELDKSDPNNQEELRILNEAITSTRSMMAKKARMRTNFMFRLRSLSDNAKEAALLFANDEFREELKRALTREILYEEPPAGEPPPEDEMPPGTGEPGAGAGEEEPPEGGET